MKIKSFVGGHSIVIYRDAVFDPSIRRYRGGVPVVTIPAAGSETSDSSVLTNEEIQVKRGLSCDQNRPRFACGSNVESHLQDPSQILPVTDRHTVFCNMTGDPDNIYLLEGIVSDQSQRYLPGKYYQRDAVIEGVRDRGYRIGGAGAAGYQTYAGLSCLSRISFRLMYQSLLMAGKDNVDITVAVQFIKKVCYSTAGIGKYFFYALCLQSAQEHFGSCNFHNTCLLFFQNVFADARQLRCRSDHSQSGLRPICSCSVTRQMKTKHCASTCFVFIFLVVCGHIQPTARRMKIHAVSVTEDKRVVATTILAVSTPSLCIFFAMI